MTDLRKLSAKLSHWAERLRTRAKAESNQFAKEGYILEAVGCDALSKEATALEQRLAEAEINAAQLMALDRFLEKGEIVGAMCREFDREGGTEIGEGSPMWHGPTLRIGPYVSASDLAAELIADALRAEPGTAPQTEEQ